MLFCGRIVILVVPSWDIWWFTKISALREYRKTSLCVACVLGTNWLLTYVMLLVVVMALCLMISCELVNTVCIVTDQMLGPMAFFCPGGGLIGKSKKCKHCNYFISPSCLISPQLEWPLYITEGYARNLIMCFY